MSLEPIAILGSGGHAREILHLLETINARRPRFEILGFLDSDSQRHGRIVNDVAVLGDVDWIEKSGEDRASVVFGINAPRIKRRLTGELRSLGVDFPTVVHPDVQVGRWVELGRGVVVTAGCVMTCNIELGQMVCLNRQVGVGHDVKIGEFSTINPHVVLSGNVTVGPGCEVGTNAAVIQGLTIGEGSIIGAGAAVIRDTPANTTAVGNPSKPIKKLTPWEQR